MIDIERQKKNFKDHVATFQDLGNIKILDFQNPGHCEYRIRFLFEEDHYRLHISGDLGELIAYNFQNMRYETFGDFVHNTGYFEEKILCHNRPIHCYDREKAKSELIAIIKEYDLIIDKDEMEDKVSEILADFDEKSGISYEGHRILEEIAPDCWEYTYDLGIEDTGILDLYILAFKLAQEDLKRQESEVIKNEV